MPMDTPRNPLPRPKAQRGNEVRSPTVIYLKSRAIPKEKPKWHPPKPKVYAQKVGEKSAFQEACLEQKITVKTYQYGKQRFYRGDRLTSVKEIMSIKNRERKAEGLRQFGPSSWWV